MIALNLTDLSYALNTEEHVVHNDADDGPDTIS